jgi:hypothetical protein
MDMALLHRFMASLLESDQTLHLVLLTLISPLIRPPEGPLLTEFEY